MLLSERLTKLFNQQVNQELYSAYLYLDFAEYFKQKNMPGFGHWYAVQAQEEISHASRFMDYMIKQGRRPELLEIAKPDAKYKNDVELGNAGLAHEVLITEMINKIYDVALEEKDYRTMEFLDWFIKEQSEEEENACDMVSLLEQIEGNNAAIYFADMKMREREG